MKLTLRTALAVSALAFGASFASMASAQNLYPGEEFVTLAGFPAIQHFTAGQPDSPLIIFAPGAHHTARIVTGGHEGYNPDAFLAHQLGQRGYNFLALSYPIATDSGAMPEDTPTFSSRDWAAQITEAASAHIAEHGLTGEIYLITWSMAGKVAQPAHAAMAEAGHPLSAVFSFASTPGIPGIINLTTEFDRTESGYVDRRSAYMGWFNQMAANAEGGEPVIPQDVYLTDYVGHMSGNLQGYGEVFQDDGTIRIDHMAQALDYGAFEFMNFPLIVNFQVDGRADARHAVLDHAYFSLYNTHTLFGELGRRGVRPADLSDAAWEELQAVSRSAAEALTIDVGGNHLFFVGDNEASDTADAIEQAIEAVAAWNARVDAVFAQ